MGGDAEEAGNDVEYIGEGVSGGELNIAQKAGLIIMYLGRGGIACLMATG